MEIYWFDYRMLEVSSGSKLNRVKFDYLQIVYILY